jgi:hypothetical protein
VPQDAAGYQSFAAHVAEQHAIDMSGKVSDMKGNLNWYEDVGIEVLNWAQSEKRWVTSLGAKGKCWEPLASKYAEALDNVLAGITWTELYRSSGEGDEQRAVTARSYLGDAGDNFNDLARREDDVAKACGTTQVPLFLSQ